MNYTKRFRAKLRPRRRKRGKSIQAVYLDVRRLLALGFPGQSGGLCEIIGRDAFLVKLANSDLRISILDQSPSTPDEALSIVCRMGAYGITTLEHDDDGSEDQLTDHREVHVVNAVHMSDDVRVERWGETGAAQSLEIQQLQVNVEEQRRDVVQAAVVSASCPLVDPSPSAWSHPSGSQLPSAKNLTYRSNG